MIPMLVLLELKLNLNYNHHQVLQILLLKPSHEYEAAQGAMIHHMSPELEK